MENTKIILASARIIFLSCLKANWTIIFMFVKFVLSLFLQKYLKQSKQPTLLLKGVHAGGTM